MCNNYTIEDLNKRITAFRKKLDDLLITHNSNSDAVLEVSRMLDILIVEYYQASTVIEKKYKFDNNKSMR